MYFQGAGGIAQVQQASYAGRRYAVTGTPVQPIQVLIEQACRQAPGGLDPGLCTLYLNKKALQSDEPIRFAGIPRNSVLTLTSSATLSKCWAKYFPVCQHNVHVSDVDKTSNHCRSIPTQGVPNINIGRFSAAVVFFGFTTQMSLFSSKLTCISETIL